MSVPRGPASGAVARFAIEVTRRLFARAVDGVVNAIVWVWCAYWTGTLLTAFVILTGSAVALYVVLGEVSLSAHERASTLHTAGVILMLLLVLKVLVFALIPRKR